MPTIGVLAPIVLVGLAFLVYCYMDLAKITEVRYLPKWGWAIICAISIPLGGIIYLIAGRSPQSHVD
jgi:hypothetical protein